MAEDDDKIIGKIEIGCSFEDDFRRLRQMLYKMEELKRLVPDWHEVEAERIHSEILELACETIDANAYRSTEDKKPKDGK